MESTSFDTEKLLIHVSGIEPKLRKLLDKDKKAKVNYRVIMSMKGDYELTCGYTKYTPFKQSGLTENHYEASY